MIRAIGAWDFLDLVGAIGPVRWTETSNGDRFVMAGLSTGAPLELPDGVIPVSPRRYYDGILTSASRELAWLFLAGLGVMGIYLAALQRSVARVLYVLAPLSLSALAFAVYVRHTGATVDIIHVLAFSIIIALATDYASILVSTGHAPPEQAKILLTGASTLATFAVLWSARHPLLRELGATVTLGCAVSLAFALFVRLPAADEGPGP
jgi:predicted exporter